MIKEKYEGRLSTKEIDTISEKISDWSKKDKSISSEYIRLRLSIEEALISIYEKNDKNDIDVSVQLINKFNTTAIVIHFRKKKANLMNGLIRCLKNWDKRLSIR